MGRVPKRLKTGDKPIVAAVTVKVESDNNKEEEEEEEELLDIDNNEEEEDKGQEERVAQPVAQVEQPQYVPPRPKYILMDYDKSMGDGVIPDNKVLRLKNHWCYTILDPVFWVLGREQHRQMSDLQSMLGMLQQQTYGKVLPNLQNKDVNNIEKRQR
jgi:hypothetical protein